MVGILLLGVVTALYVYVFWTCCTPPPKLVPINSNGSGSDSILNDPNLLYAKRAFIGLCRTKSGYEGSCHYRTYLYSSGKLVIESGELTMELDGEKATTFPTIQKELDENLMSQVTEKIRDSVITNKTCETDTAATRVVSDYYVSYFINLDGIKREVKFPACEAEFKDIDKLIDSVADKSEMEI